MTAVEQVREKLDETLETSGFKKSAADAAKYLREKLHRSEETRDIADALHGKALGHPLHPLLTDVTIGSWTLSLVFDVLGLMTGSRAARNSADTLTLIGNVTAVPTAISGMTDYSGIKQDSAGYAAVHGIVNGFAFFCFVNSTLARIRGKRGSAFFFSALGLSAATIGGWLGGDMVYRQRVGVNHAPTTPLKDWTPLMPEADVRTRKLIREHSGEHPVLVYKDAQGINAIGARCSHAGGPLEEGTVEDGCVHCPWHDSVFDLHTGEVVHGPAVFSQPRYDTRIEDDQVEIKTYVPEARVPIEIQLEAEANQAARRLTNNGLDKPPRRAASKTTKR